MSVINFDDYKSRRLPENIRLNLINSIVNIWEKYKDSADSDIVLYDMIKQIRAMTIFLPDCDRERLFKKVREDFSDIYFY